VNVVIVGCGNVGFETARLLGGKHTLLIVNRSYPADLERFVQEHDRVSFALADATDLSSMSSALAGFEDSVGRIDALVSTVGTPGSGSALENFKQFKDEFNLNFFGNFVPVKAALERMLVQQWGQIVVISSTSGVHTYPGWGAYAPVKWALTNLCRTLRKEVGPQGISVDVVFPRTIKNQRSKTFLNEAGVEPQQVAREIARVLRRKKGTDRFVPKRYELLRPLERIFPQMLDRRAGLRRKRKTQLCSRPLHTAMINGATSPLGTELARCYAATAESLCLVGSDERVLSEIKAGLGRSSPCTVRVFTLSKGNAEEIRCLVDRTGRLDLIVNCGDAGAQEELADVSVDACEHSLEVSFFAQLQLLTEYLRRDMRPHKIINVLSTSVATGRQGHGCSSAGQAALWAQTRALRRTVGNHMQIMEVLLSVQDDDTELINEAADRIRAAERRGKETMVFPLRSRMALYLDAICPRVFT